LRSGCDGRRTETLGTEIPRGVFELQERWAESEPLDVHLPDAVRRCQIRGRLDPVIRLDAGGSAVVGFTAGECRAESLALHARALHASAYVLEHPASGGPGPEPVRRLGLLVFEPRKLSRGPDGLGTLGGRLDWIEIPRDDGLLFGFLAEVLSVLDRPDPPGGAPLCDWCVYRDASRRTGL
jgi:hypothetical protein